LPHLRARLRFHRGRHGDDRLFDRRDGPDRPQRIPEQRPSVQLDERLGHIEAQARAGTGGDDDGGGFHFFIFESIDARDARLNGQVLRERSVDFIG
jgi:hypothetical protein